MALMMDLQKQKFNVHHFDIEYFAVWGREEEKEEDEKKS